MGETKGRARVSERRKPVSGLLNIDKPQGLTSHDMVDAVRRMAGQRRVGHAGTLDPLATGVLVVCLGQATRVTEYLVGTPKTYRARFHLGIATDTYDAEGRITQQVDTLTVTRPDIEQALAAFMGYIEQVPPMYSALKRGGKPLHRLARRGMTVPRQPRPVEIYALEVTEWVRPVVTLRLECSSGTYVRSLAHDLGQRLGCGAHLVGLTRLASGRFRLEEAVSLEALEEAFAGGYEDQFLYPIDEALLDYDAMIVDQATARRIFHGQQVPGQPPGTTSLCRAYSLQGDLIALLEHDAETGLWQPKKVFATEPEAINYSSDPC